MSPGCALGESAAAAVQTPSAGELVTIAEAAACLAVSRVTIWRWIRDGRLPALRAGPRSVRIRRRDLDRVVRPLAAGRPRAGLPLQEVVQAEQLRLVTDALPALISYIDRDFRYRFNNRAYEVWFRRPRSEMLGSRVADVVGEEAFREAAPYMERALAGETVSFGLWLPYRTAGRRYIAATYVPHLGPDRAVEGFFALVSDTTARRRVEERQRFLSEVGALLSATPDYEATLRELARLTVPAIADWCAVDVLEDTGEIKRVAVMHQDPEKIRLAHELTRRFPPDPSSTRGVPGVINSGRSQLAVEIRDEDLAAAIANPEHLSILRSLGLKSALVVPLTARGRTFGAITLVHSESSRHYDAEDLAFAEDLARRAALAIDNARLYDRERAARIAAEEATRARDEFLLVAAHELRTPITALHGFTQVMLRNVRRSEGADSARLERGLAIVDAQAGKLAALVTQLLDVSRLEGGQLRLDPRPTDLPALLRQVVATAEAASDARRIVVEAPESMTACVDPLRLEQVMTNLIDNAFKYSPKDRQVRLELAAPTPAEVLIAVTDGGPGIPPGSAERVFERFYRANPRQGSGGMGLGLYISRQIVRLHGGEISVERPPEGGTRFLVRLPVRPSEAPDSNAT